ncbi:hypothetical protein NHJ6243_003431 [Beauveria neobassiana]
MSLSESTIPLDEEYRDTLEYCGRTFHKYSLETGTYFAPVDEEEIERLELMHNVLSKVFDNRLIFPPMVTLRKILDCGCGAANWAVDVAEQYPDCEVLGIDVSPHMLPEHPPRNLDFRIDDLNARSRFVEMVKSLFECIVSPKESQSGTANGGVDGKRRLH